jgi:RimJ/RimL family protein N-acetyltransferase
MSIRGIRHDDYGDVVIELRASDAHDLQSLPSWIGSDEEMRLWSGPGFSWPLSAEQVQAYFEESRSGRRLLWSAVTTKDAVLIGHASLRFQVQNNVGRLGRVLVDPARRGEGLGRALVTSAVVAGFAQSQINVMTLGVYRQNTTARRLYESIGFTFTQTTTAPTTVGDHSWDSMEMQLPRQSFDTTRA